MKKETSNKYINIYMLNNNYIMLDHDLAKIFECPNGVLELNYIVRKNIRLFSNNDYFLLTNLEYKSIVMQNNELERKYIEQKRNLPYAFSEYGVYLLSIIIKTQVALIIQKELIVSFINMKNFINQNMIISQELSIDNKVMISKDDQSYSNNYDKLFMSFNKEQNYKKNKYAFYKGKVYEYNKIISTILEEAKNNIIIIDNHIDINVLKVIDKSSIKIILITNRENIKSKSGNLIVRYSSSFSETFILIDCKKLYHSSDMNETDNFSCVAINTISDKELINAFRRKVYLHI